MAAFVTTAAPPASRAGRSASRCATPVPLRYHASGQPRVLRHAVESPETLAEREAQIKDRVRGELAEAGVDLDQLMNPEKVVKLERKIEEKNEVLQGGELDPAAREKAAKELDRMRGALVVEKRMVMQAWLKNLFLYQGVFTAVLGGFLSSGHLPGWEGELPLVARALGFWMVWLFTIPSWRARKPAKWEKSALNVAFLATPVTNLAIPFFSKDTFLIWGTNIAVTALCYAYYYGKDGNSGSGGSEVKIKGVLKYLDWGSWR